MDSRQAARLVALGRLTEILLVAHLEGCTLRRLGEQLVQPGVIGLARGGVVLVDKEDDQGPRLGALDTLQQVPKALQRGKLRAGRRLEKATFGGCRRLDSDPLRTDGLELHHVGRDLGGVPAVAVQLVHAVSGLVIDPERWRGAGLGGERQGDRSREQGENRHRRDERLGEVHGALPYRKRRPT